MRELFYQFSRCWAFTSIQHKHLPYVIVYIPVCAAFLLTFALSILPLCPRLSGDESILSYLINIVSTLPGFFIAALAAVATFQNTTLDKVMDDPAPTLALRSLGKDEPIPLTLRFFLSNLFSFLTTLSLIILVWAIGIQILAGNVRLLVVGNAPENYNYVLIVLKLLTFFYTSWAASCLATTTLYGLYFLSERIHRTSA